MKVIQLKSLQAHPPWSFHVFCVFFNLNLLHNFRRTIYKLEFSVCFSLILLYVSGVLTSVWFPLESGYCLIQCHMEVDHEG
uniref:Uncharacterized protein n=1 Tax=Rhizophora mucronata TaxID=61149 RepID=A0A2P2L320_RHIMU